MPYRTPAPMMGPDVVVVLCKYCFKLKSVCDARPTGDHIFNDCRMARALERRIQLDMEEFEDGR